MGIIIFLVMGAIVGWLAAAIMGRHEGLVGSIVIGIVGSLIGSIVSGIFVGSDQAYLAFSWTGFFWSLLGAVILVALLNAFTGWRASNRNI